MKKIFLYVVLILCFAVSAFALQKIPGAYGFGSDTRGAYAGTGNPIICVVTSVADTTGSWADDTIDGQSVKVGTLRQCIDSNPGSAGKIIIFAVSGTIVGAQGTSNYYKIDYPATEIRGETAPSPGINLTNILLNPRSSDIVISHIRVREGDAPGFNPDSRDAISVGSGPGESNDNIFIVQSSFSHSTDENGNPYVTDAAAALTNVGFWRCIFSNGLHNSIHTDAGHSKGMQISSVAYSAAPDGVSLIQCLFTNSRNRGIRLGYAKNVAAINIGVYNFQMDSEYGSWFQDDRISNFSMIGNAYLGGPLTSANGKLYFAEAYDGGGTTTASFYADDNRVGYSTAGTPTWNEIQTGPTDLDGVYIQGSANPTFETSNNVTISGYTPMDSEDVIDFLKTYAGARPLDRDLHDAQVISDIESGAGGYVDTTHYAVGDCTGSGTANDGSGEVTLHCCTGVDTWDCTKEDIQSLTENTRSWTLPSNPHDDDDSDGYTNIEEWLQALAAALESEETPISDTGGKTLLRGTVFRGTLN